MSNEIMRSLNSLVKYNNGLFKSEKQAKYLLSKCQEPYKYYGTGHIGGQNWSGSYQLHFSLDDKGVTRVEKCTSKGGCKITWERMSNDKFTSNKKEDAKRLIQSYSKEIDNWEEYLTQPTSQLEELNAFENDTELKYKSGEYNDQLYSSFIDVIKNKRDELNSDIERVALNINKLKEQLAHYQNVLNESIFIPFLESLRNDQNSTAITAIKNGYSVIYESRGMHISEEMLSKYNLDPDDVHYLGSGDFGSAYSIGDGKVLKITTSKSEAELAHQIMNGKFSSFVTVYSVEPHGGEYYIIQEELEEDSDLENAWYEVSEALESQGLPVQYVGNFDEDEYAENGGELSEEATELMNALWGISSDYRRLGIEASDIRVENIGRSSDGTIKAFDIDDRSRL